ncbi:DUF2812 domain-containing protein [Aquibacillus halophilus]|uniref:DUF2812 domain-containing protein n=1 Tax=Aquibacillus halophilus TaxID=930132 RepID=A0A6A8DE08_9BACI|nr:DUF2812 domain-containing protein [Aquibacillus halophilus]
MKDKLKKKILWLDLWDIEEQEAWFSDMATHGWELIKINKFTATFIKSEPQRIKYRCDVFKLPYSYEDERIEIYRQSGWEHVASRGYLQVFKQVNKKNTNELHTDPFEQAEALTLLKKDISTRGVISLVLSILMLFLSFFMLQSSPVRNFLEDEFIAPFMIILSILLIIFSMTTGMVHMSKLMKKLHSGTLLNEVNYRKKLNRNRWLGGSFIFILSSWILFNTAQTIALSGERFPEIPDKELPVVEISDILNETNYTRIPDMDDFPGSIDNYYKEEASILVPKQYELYETVEVPGVMWDDNSGSYQPSIQSYRYDVRSEWLAKQFLQELIEENQYLDENYQLTITQFDELWLNQEDNKTDLIARKDNVVYRVVHYGKETADEIISEVEIKAGY